MSEVQLVVMLRKIKKIVDETEIYNKRLILLKENGLSPNSNSIFEEDEELLFPIDIGNEMYLKASKAYQEYKAYIEGIEKTLNKYVDKINKNERSSAMMKAIANNNGNSNNTNGNQSSNSSSSDDDDTDKFDKRNSSSLKRKSKEVVSTPSASNKTKRIKQPSESPKNESSSESPTVSTPAKTVESTSTPKADKNTNTSAAATAAGESSAQIPPGTQVAAKEKSNNWILAKVGSYNSKTQKYEVIDEDEDESKKFHVSIKDIIQLPSANSLPPTFAANTKVLAMFPDTTTFYPAVVVSSQKVKNKTSFYTLHFDDDQGDNGQTPSRKVAAQHYTGLVNPSE
ncbi:DUF1325 family protein [Heterostelium album PN500]|uniref:DUF1325 family protein n=1 Tax=Heterostelium pallidum (strain ATCC 26659 / Pp 5 / PN500) TaxID=670386 RepID=D3BMD1_HETP5|nr:DUF1325 family protein [Heterostelium album PN500]EFA77732.1 DUF1325 family protein [Heterostelium album PN500]|eukprot:XP_020429860.1 DUF1325 family protein [Heterostelium album PN500]